MKLSQFGLKKTGFVFLVLFALIVTIPLIAQAVEVLPMLKAKEKIVRQILATPTQVDTDAHKAKEEKLRQTINDLFDFEELGMRALELHWDDLNDAQHKEFISLLQQLIEKNYLLKITKATTYMIAWGKEIQEEEWKTVGIKIKSGKYEATIHFRLVEKGGKAVVFDMLIDDVSLMENYRSQFNRIIKKDGFEKLLEKMRSRLSEMESGAGDEAKDLDAPDKPASAAQEPPAPAAQ
jgi:phospholipid transport system substrate-binding protein